MDGAGGGPAAGNPGAAGNLNVKWVPVIVEVGSEQTTGAVGSITIMQGDTILAGITEVDGSLWEEFGPRDFELVKATARYELNGAGRLRSSVRPRRGVKREEAGKP